MNRVRALLQAVGFLTLALLAIYGVLAFASGAGPVPGALSARAQEALPNPVITAPELVTGTLVAAPEAVNGIAPTVNYQGLIRLPDGTLPTKFYKITASVYDEIAGVNKPLYTITRDKVPVVNGVFNIILGQALPGDPPLPANAFSDAPRYIGINLNEGAGELSPRQHTHSVPWAMTASTLVQNASVGNFSADHINATGVSVGGAVNAGSAAVTGDVAAAHFNGTAYYGETVNVNREVRMPRTYAMFQMYKGYGSDSARNLGPWDLCVLAGHQVLGSDANGGTCFVQMAGWQTGFDDFGPLTVGQNDRKGWVLYGSGAGGTAVRCEAVCMNFSR